MAKIKNRRQQISSNFEVLDMNVCGIQFIQSRRTLHLTPGTIEFYNKRIKEIKSYFLSQNILTINEITSVNIRDYLDWLELRGHNQGGTHIYYRVLKVFLKWIWEEYEIDVRNPIDKVKCLNRPPTPIEGITIDEVQACLDACDQTKFPERARAIISVLADTGLRRTELLELKMKDIRLSDGRITVRHGKGDKFRIVYCGKLCRKSLRKYINCLEDINENDSLWLSLEGEPLGVDGLRWIIRSVQQLAGLNKIHEFHDFRRFFALERKRNGDDDIVISRALGHSSLEVTKRYLAFSSDDDRDFALRASPIDNMK